MTSHAHTIDTLAAFIAELDLDEVPTAVRDKAQVLLLDSVACALAGRDGGQVHEAAALARALGGAGHSSVVGVRERYSPGGAALLGSYLITGVNACDIYQPAFTHVTPLVVPCALIAAELKHRSGKDLLTAVLAGSEVVTRIGRALDFPAFEERGWQAPGVIGPFGGAAAAAKLLGLDVEETANALALAGSQAAGTAADWGTPANKFQQFRGALSGLTAALLAAEGFPAGRGVLDDDRGGLYRTYAPGDPSRVLADLGESWETELIGLRRWPTAANIQGVVTALVELCGDRPVEASEVEQVTVRVSPQVHARHGGVSDPRTKFQRLQSIHYVAAVLLADGRLWLDQFDDERAVASDVERLLAGRVAVEADPGLEGVAAGVTVHIGGEERERACEAPKGDPANPLSVEDVEDKLRAAALPHMPAERVEGLLATLRGVADFEDSGELLAELRG